MSTGTVLTTAATLAARHLILNRQLPPACLLRATVARTRLASRTRISFRTMASSDKASHPRAEDTESVPTAVDTPTTTFDFGPYKVPAFEAFFWSEHALAMVNLKPVVPGHILPTRPLIPLPLSPYAPCPP
eukprot:jgi/Chlat1/7201/Chrsp57S06848